MRDTLPGEAGGGYMVVGGQVEYLAVNHHYVEQTKENM